MEQAGEPEMYVHYKEWIQYELNSAWRMGKPIVGIVPWGQERTPQEVQNVAREMIGWNTANEEIGRASCRERV